MNSKHSIAAYLIRLALLVACAVIPVQAADGNLYPRTLPDDIIDLSDALLLQKLILGPP
jgi:hypothetical protein